MTVFGQKPLASLSSTLLARKGTARPAMRPQGFGGFGSPQGQHDDLGWNDMGHTDEEIAAGLGYVPQQPYPEQAYPAEQPYPAPPTVPPVLRQREALQEEFESPAAYEPQVPRAYEPEQDYEGEDDEYDEDGEDGEEAESGGAYADLGRAANPIRPPLEDMPIPVEAAMPAPVAAIMPMAVEATPMPIEVRPVLAAAIPMPVAPRPMPVEARVEPRVETKPVSVATAKRIAKETQSKGGKAAFTLRLDQDRHLRLRLASALHNVSAQVLVTEALDYFLQSLPEVDELARQLPPQAGR
ncbi:MAG: hypothetical protein ABI240_03810 [Sphingomonas sp.]